MNLAITFVEIPQKVLELPDEIVTHDMLKLTRKTESTLPILLQGGGKKLLLS